MNEPTDYKEAERFLNTLDPNTDTFSFHCYHPHGASAIANIVGTLEKCLPALKKNNAEGYGIYVCVNNLVTVVDTEYLDDRNNENIKSIRGHWQDDDAGWKGTFPLAPTMEVQTSEGKYQRYWLLKEHVNGAALDGEFNGVMNRMVADYGCDSNAKDLCRVLRVPGFYHTKAADKKDWPLVKITEATGKRYTWNKIVKKFPPLATTPNSTDTSPSTWGEFDFIYSFLKVANATEGEVNNTLVSLAQSMANHTDSHILITNILKSVITIGADKWEDQALFEKRRCVDIPKMVTTALNNVSAENEVDNAKVLERLVTPANWPTEPKPQKHIVYNVLVEYSLTVIFGKWKQHKTFLVLYLLFCISVGRQWCGRKTYKTPVIYIAAEGQVDVVDRINALMKRYEYKQHSIYLFPQGLPLHTGEGVLKLNLLCQQVTNEMNALPLICADTLARNSSGEETNEAFSKLISTVQPLIDDKQCRGLIFVHHTGRNDAEHLRGGSSFDGASDHMFFVKKKPDNSTFKCTASRSTKDDWECKFSMEKVELDYKDYEGKHVSTLVAVETDSQFRDVKDRTGLEKVCDYIIDDCGGEITYSQFEKNITEEPGLLDGLGYKSFKSLKTTFNKKFKNDNNWEITSNGIRHVQ